MDGKRILFITFLDYFNPLDYALEYNSGNNVFQVAGISYFYSEKLNTTFVPYDVAIKKINDDSDWAYKNFDIAISMSANIFACEYKENLKTEAEFYTALKIPVFVLGAGAQFKIDYSMKNFDKFKENAKRFIDSILNSGGNISLRGNFTKEVTKKLGYPDLFVSGCPSLFIRGKNLQISNQKVSKEDFKPMLNGNFVSTINEKIYSKYPKAFFFDQSMYLKMLYNPDDNLTFKEKKYEYPFRKMYLEKRILGNMNYYLWQKQIKDGGFNFCYGSKLHGNIIALQSGVPAFIKVIDSRTREIAEFFNIPNSYQIKFNEKWGNLYNLYQDLDYSKFNKTLVEKFYAFRKFLEDNKIPNVLGENQAYFDFLSKQEYKFDKIIYSDEIAEKLPKKRLFWQ